MHDIHLANQIAKLVKEYANREGLVKIKGIKIKLGNISEHGEIISAENLRFNIRLLLGGDVSIDIFETDGNKWELLEIEGE